ncbi:hypothetical protein CXB41_20255 [Pseudomonas syringae pv. syringae]|nr:hypothetical protein CXB41_20255 [Pseudomonas syringae pv. syringae]
MQFVTLCVTRRFFFARWIEVRLRAPFRPSATYFDGAKVGKTFRSGFRPDFVGFLRPVTYVAFCVVSAIALKKHFCAKTCRQCMTSRRGCHVTQEPHA